MSVSVLSLVFISFVHRLNGGCVNYKQYESLQQYHQINPNGDGATLSKRVNMTDAANNDGAVCIDGSVPVFYWRRGKDDGINKFIIYFDGGGWCGGPFIHFPFHPIYALLYLHIINIKQVSVNSDYPHVKIHASIEHILNLEPALVMVNI